MRRAIPLALLAALALTLADAHPARAGDRTLAELNLGTHWAGPKIDRGDLAGKVVLVWLWGQ